MPSRAQLIFSSATLTNSAISLGRHLRPTIEFARTIPHGVSPIGALPTTLEHIALCIASSDDVPTIYTRLHAALSTVERPKGVLIFVDRRSQVIRNYEYLTSKRYLVATLYSEASHNERNEFKKLGHGRGTPVFGISTSVGERGIDLAHASVVVNQRVPTHTREYLHRAGRVGRLQSGPSVDYTPTEEEDFETQESDEQEATNHQPVNVKRLVRQSDRDEIAELQADAEGTPTKYVRCGSLQKGTVITLLRDTHPSDLVALKSLSRKLGFAFKIQRLSAGQLLDEGVYDGREAEEEEEETMKETQKEEEPLNV